MNNYEMLRKIGAGSFGSVYLCVQKSTAKHCVMKRIELRALNDKERHSAHQEAKLLSQLDHPNIVQHVDTLCSRSKLYLFMQYCEGGDLEHRIQSLKETSGALGEPQLLDWFVQMALALEYLHSRRILHRALKTANVFLTRRGIVKLGDFGVAKVLDATRALARTMCGTPYYLSPELLNDTPYGVASDVWALGCILHEMATLEHPFEAKNFPSLAFKILNEEPSPIAGRSAELPPLVHAALVKDPARRAPDL